MPWLKCPRDGHIWETKSNAPRVTCTHCGYKVEVQANLIDEKIARMEHFNFGEDGVRILDPSLATPNSPKGRIIDVYFKQKKIFCEYDESSDCRHVKYALGLPVVQEILKKKGWKT